ncbi:Hypothetical predicted protein [Lecanosticta acicola]|uniref:Uncharacterized protein n=1 Tax=Lecanosticta acicola TaxID=111012 RepID=A0AAI8YX92_9PEZI|nr:Hypothetical predicted protein [Lecanosticta acicola]
MAPTNRSSASNEQQHASQPSLQVPATPNRHDSVAPNHSEEHYSQDMKDSLRSLRRAREASGENDGDLQEHVNGILAEVALIGPLLESSRQHNARQAALIEQYVEQVAALNEDAQRKDVELAAMAPQLQNRDEELQRRIEDLQLDNQAKAARIQEFESKIARQAALTEEYAHKMATMKEESQSKDGELAAMAQKFHDRERELLHWIEVLQLENRTVVVRN